MHARSCWALLVALPVWMIWAGAAWAAAKVYVADEQADTVSVIDTASFKTVATVPVGKLPHNVQVSPDGRQAWVTNNGDPVGADAHGSMTPAEHEAMPASGAVWVIDTASDKVVAKVPVGAHPAHVVLTPDGRHAYVTNGGDNTVSVVDTGAHRVVSTIHVGRYPHGIRISPDGTQAYVANLKDATVSVIDTASRKAVARIAVGKGPAQVGFTPDGRLAFVSLSQEGAVAVIDPATRKVIAKVAVGNVPIQLYATPDSRLLLVANQGSRDNPGNTVSVVALDGFKVTHAIETGPGAHGVVVDREGRFAYVTNIYANSVSVLDVAARKVVAQVRVGNAPNGITITP